jgi:hypothetical protein
MLESSKKDDIIKKGNIRIDNLFVVFYILSDDSVVINKVYYYTVVNDVSYYSEDIYNTLDDFQVEYLITNVVKSLEK